jgi:hypothetical protein
MKGSTRSFWHSYETSAFEMARGYWEAPCLFDPPTKWMKGEMWFRVTQPDGKHRWLQSSACTEVRFPVEIEQKDQPTIKCIIEMGTVARPVREEMDMVMKVLRKNE